MKMKHNDMTIIVSHTPAFFTTCYMTTDDDMHLWLQIASGASVDTSLALYNADDIELYDSGTIFSSRKVKLR